LDPKATRGLRIAPGFSALQYYLSFHFCLREREKTPNCPTYKLQSRGGDGDFDVDVMMKTAKGVSSSSSSFSSRTVWQPG